MIDDRLSASEILDAINDSNETESLIGMMRQAEFAAKLAALGMKTLDDFWRREANYQNHMLGEGFEEWFRAVTRDIPDMFSRNEVRSLFGDEMAEEFERRRAGAGD